MTVLRRLLALELTPEQGDRLMLAMAGLVGLVIIAGILNEVLP